MTFKSCAQQGDRANRDQTVTDADEDEIRPVADEAFVRGFLFAIPLSLLLWVGIWRLIKALWF